MDSLLVFYHFSLSSFLRHLLFLLFLFIFLLFLFLLILTFMFAKKRFFLLLNFFVLKKSSCITIHIGKEIQCFHYVEGVVSGHCLIGASGMLPLKLKHIWGSLAFSEKISVKKYTLPRSNHFLKIQWDFFFFSNIDKKSVIFFGIKKSFYEYYKNLKSFFNTEFFSDKHFSEVSE